MVNINSGGGGIALGNGSIASGKGGDIVIGPRASETVVQLSSDQFGDLIGALGDLKASLIRAQIDRDFVTRVAGAEQQIIAGDGKFGAQSMRQLLAQVRFAGRGDAGVSAAVNRVASPVRARPPADVFISYKREERARVELLVRALEALAITVWSDAQLQSGRSFTQEICEELDGCKVQIVCWSPAASVSDWVLGEAEYGRARDILAPVVLAPCRLAPPFNMIHAEDLSAWRGEASHEGWRKLLALVWGAVAAARPRSARVPHRGAGSSWPAGLGRRSSIRSIRASCGWRTMINFLELLGAGAAKAEQGSELKSGVAVVRERTIELGARVLWLGNIGTIRIIEGSRSHLLLIVGGLLALAGLATLPNDGVMGFMMILLGAGLIYINLNQKVTGGLSIGTCDGRSTLIVSTDKEFLSNMLEFLRRKIDSENPKLQGEFNITNRHVESGGGGIALGVGSIASGLAGRVEAAVRDAATAWEAPPAPAAPQAREREPVVETFAQSPPTPRPVTPPPKPAERAQAYAPVREYKDHEMPTERRDGGAGRWIGVAIALALVVVVAAGAAGFYYWTQISAPPPVEVAEQIPATSLAPSFTVEQFTPDAPLTARTEGAPVRTAPTSDGQVFTTLLPGEPFSISGRVVGNFPGAWLAVRLPNGAVGYVDERFLAAAPVLEEEGLEATEDTVQIEPLPDVAEVEGKPEPFDITSPTWATRPDAAAFARVYPRRALREGRDGRVVLECFANADGTLVCTVLEETPSGYGFGNAALRVAREFRLQPVMVDGRSVAGGRVRIPIGFRLG